MLTLKLMEATFYLVIKPHHKKGFKTLFFISFLIILMINKVYHIPVLVKISELLKKLYFKLTFKKYKIYREKMVY